MRSALIVIAVAAVAGCASDGPVLLSVEPAAGRAGDHVTITGERLCQGACDPLPAAYVSFGIDPQIDGTVTAWSDTAIAAIVPSGLAPGDLLIVVTVDGRSSNGVSFQAQ